VVKMTGTTQESTSTDSCRDLVYNPEADSTFL
jgi:hypothetical protein